MHGWFKESLLRFQLNKIQRFPIKIGEIYKSLITLNTS